VLYQTTVKPDPASLVRSWIPSSNWGWQGVGGSLLDADRLTESAIEEGALKLLRKMNEKREKERRCAGPATPT
jgi:hypothetical protein